MSQSVILDNFILYLHLKKTEKNSQYNPVIVDNLIQGFREGNCWAFSLCYAVEAQENLNYWRIMLFEAYHWSGTPGALTKDIFLPGSLGKEKITLGDLFEKLIHYIAFHQLSQSTRSFLTVYEAHEYWQEAHYTFARSVPSVDFKNLSHHNILGTGVKCFELISNKHEVKHIQGDVTIKDKFIEKELSYLLDANTIKDSICLIYTDKHAIAIIYDRGLLGVYDPNYPHDSILTLDKFFDNKSKLAEEIIRILGNELTIKLASLAWGSKEKLVNWEKSFLRFKSALVNDAYKTLLNIKNNNLDYFTFTLKDKMENFTDLGKVALSFDHLENFLHFSQNNKKLAELLCELIYSFECFPILFSFILERSKAFFFLLKISTEEKFSCFFNFILERPGALFSLLEIYIDKEITCIINFLFATNRHEKTALEVLQTKRAKELTNILKLVKKSSVASKTFFSQVKLNNRKDLEFLNWIKFLDKRNFSIMLAILKNTPEGAMWLNEQLLRRNKATGEIALWSFQKHGGKQYAPFLLACVANNKALGNSRLLKEKYPNALTGQEIFQDSQEPLSVESKSAVKLNSQFVPQTFFCESNLLSRDTMPEKGLDYRSALSPLT